MEWVPQQMWFTYLRIGEQSGNLRHDLAIDKYGDAAPSRVMAGLEAPLPEASTTSTTAAPTTTTAKPKPKPAPKPPITPTTASPAPPTTTPTIDPSLSVIVEPSTPTSTAPPSGTVALPPALPTSHSRSGPSAAILIAAVGGGALAAGLTAWQLQTRSRRRTGA
jgi:hypothetical protein